MIQEIKDLKDLFIAQGRELYDATIQEQQELPSIRDEVRDDKLRSIINRQLTTSKDQAMRLQEAFKTLEITMEGEKDEFCKTILDKTKDIIKRSKDSKVRDAAIISSIQRLNHNKISAFGTLRAYANEIGQDKIANTLYIKMQEEKDIDSQLSSLAEMEINKKALLSEV